MKYDRENGKPYSTFGYTPTFGKASVRICCPFCDAIVTAYVWSLAGGGKKCVCGAIHTSFGLTYPIKK